MGININVVRSSFDLVRPIANVVADRLYEKLFQDHPEAKVFFANLDMQKQKNNLIVSLSTVVNHLDRPDQLTRYLLSLGENHARYGVEDHHYHWVGLSLMKALKECLNESWTPEVEHQWTEVYGIIAEAMKAGVKRSKSNIRSIHREASIDMSSKSVTKDDLHLVSSLVLTESAKSHIRNLVDQAFEALIQKEVSLCIEESLQKIEKLTTSDLIKNSFKEKSSNSLADTRNHK